MDIKLHKLVLENFKGVKSFTLDLQGKSCQVEGDNGTGKSTIMDGFFWLLFNKDSRGKADFAIKTLDEEGRELHNLTHSVEGILELDGKAITLKKVFKEVYTKKRGSPVVELQGHTTDYFIDSVPVQKKDWDSRIQALIKEEEFKLLTSPAYFNSLHWQKRREILLDVAGDVSDEVVLNSMCSSVADNADRTTLASILNQRNLDDHRKLIASRRREINERLKELPARIDELSKSITDVSGLDPEIVNQTIEALQHQVDTLVNGSGLPLLHAKKATLDAELSAAKADLSKVIAEAKAAHSGANIELRLQDLNAKRDQVVREIKNLDGEIALTERSIVSNNAEIARLRDEFDRIANEEFTGKTQCPTCGQGLPVEQVQAAIEKHNEGKARTLADIKSRGKQIKAVNIETETRLASLVSLKEGKKKALETIDIDRLGIAEDMEIAKGALEKVIAAAGTAEKARIAEIEAEIVRVSAEISDFVAPDTTSLKAALETERGKLAQIATTKKTRERISELAEEEKALAREFEALERELYLTERFIVAKVELLEKKINDCFDLARFKLFDTQINGGIAETCVTTVNGVPYGSGLNSGAEINVGLDIIRTLSAHYGIKAPVFVDHAESVTSILDPGTQIITLTVVPGREALNVQYA